MAEIEHTIEVNLPLPSVYKAWTEFREYPRFMEGVDEVRQMRDGNLHWVAEVDGERTEWDAHITELVPNRKLVWQSDDSRVREEAVSFSTVGPERTRVKRSVHYEPDGPEMAGDWLGTISRRIEGDLMRFRDYVEKHGQEPGAWRQGIGLHSPNQPSEKAS